MKIFDTIRSLIIEGDTRRAFEELTKHLKQSQSNPEFLRVLQVVEANYSRIKDKEIKGVLDSNEAQLAYAKTNDALLEVIAALEEGRMPAVDGTGNEAKKTMVYWLIGGGIVLFLGLIAGILLTNRGATIILPVVPAVEKADESCPSFDTSSRSVMLVPFVNQGEGNSRPEVAIQTLIRDLTTKNNIKTDVELFLGEQFKLSPPDNAAATDIGMACRADMVIWGTYEKLNNGISIDVRYLFTNHPDRPQVAINETFKSLSELKSDRSTYKSFDDAVFSLCTVMALHDGNRELAKKWVSKVKDPVERDRKIMGMLK